MDFTDAVCRQFVASGQPNLWLSGALRDQRRAMALCRTCPVAVDCMNYALAAQERPTTGVWAGRLFGGTVNPGHHGRNKKGRSY